ncbi:protein DETOXIFICATION 44, chloroplastic isoform X2 [Cryptomeria japonica]|uniref:protein DETOXIFICATION 44, chloroplastic isoform X2 n=1 Tax=Cryptomeria japonica TaxID=3369 RepID=UPI0027DA587E|nr:protein DETOXIFICATION 44, chloroplastic isoform X2 [Cryptomeria japonica]
MSSIYSMGAVPKWLFSFPTWQHPQTLGYNSRTKAICRRRYESIPPLEVLCRVRWRRGRRLKASRAQKDPSTNTDTSIETSALNQKETKENVDNLYTGFLQNIRNTFKTDELGWEISLLVFPAIVSLAAEPIASLVDTAFVGHIGPVELAAVGVSISIFNIVSKLFNIPLLNVTTSFVAEEASRDFGEKVIINQAYDRQSKNYTRGHWSLEDKDKLQETLAEGNNRLQLPAVSTALVLAAGLGVVEAVVLTLGAGYLLNFMGVPVDSPMRLPAEQYLSLRALGAPGTVVSLAVQGVFRGFKDTKTPLYATGAGNILNTLLDPIAMFTLGFGISGAAVTTALSEEMDLLPSNMEELRFDRYVKSGGLLLGRTVAILVTMTLGTSMAARQGAIAMAAHQICIQVWLAVSLLTDSLALAGQALVASAVAKKDYKKAKVVAFRILKIGLGCGLASALILFVGFTHFSKLFTNDTAVFEIMTSGVLFVAGTQPLNALAFVFDGLHYGVSDFAYATYSMIVVGTISSVWLVVAPSSLGLGGVWIGLGLFMGLRMVAGFLRLGAKSGPWYFLRQDMEESDI